MGNGASNEEATGNGGEGRGTNQAMETLEYLVAQVERGKSQGVDFSEVEEMLTAARIMVESGELDDAVDIINQCMEKASKRFSEHERLIVGIRKAGKEIKAVHDSGGDVSEASRYLKLSRIHLENGDYILGIEAAKQAIDALARKGPKEIAWGSGLAESQS